MCGIAGVIRPDAGRPEAPAVPGDVLRAMTGALAHRGPDGQGCFTAPGLGLGHRRLSVIDLAGGAQPMASADGQRCVVFNGEIYNHLELRKELEAQGARFRTRSDTEVLLHGHRAWGEGLLDRLRGMFAFALWDARHGELVLARDALGEKPLFYAQLPDRTLLFASEARALLRHPGVCPAVDPEGLAAYLTFEYLPGDLCMFAGIRKLRPGHLLTFRRGALIRRRWFRLRMDAPPPGAAAEDEGRGLRERLDTAVERCLVSDVPVGVFLSGGIDSSSLAASVVRHRDARDVRTFSIGFDHPGFDESGVARRVAAFLGTEHHERVFSERELVDRVPRATASLDEPFGDPSYLPMHLLCEFARGHVKVALGGDGADELLYGYAPFRAESAAALFARAPAFARRLLARAAEALPVRTGYMSADFVARRFVSAAAAPAAERHPRWLASTLPGSPDDPLHPELRRRFPRAAVLRPAVEAYRSALPAPHLQCVSHQYATTYLPDDILHKTDRASMAHSLEVRAPFLDRDLAAFLAGLPPSRKMDRRGRTKLALRRAMGERLPAEVLRRAKRGFAVPMADWLKGPLRPLSAELLDPRRLREAGYLDAGVVARLRREHEAGVRDHRKLLWTLMVFELWRDRCGVGSR